MPNIFTNALCKNVYMDSYIHMWSWLTVTWKKFNMTIKVEIKSKTSKKKKAQENFKLILLILKKKPMDILESSDNSRCALFCAEYSSSPEKLREILKHT